MVRATHFDLQPGVPLAGILARSCEGNADLVSKRPEHSSPRSHFFMLGGCLALRMVVFSVTWTDMHYASWIFMVWMYSVGLQGIEVFGKMSKWQSVRTHHRTTFNLSPLLTGRTKGNKGRRLKFVDGYIIVSPGNYANTFSDMLSDLSSYYTYVLKMIGHAFWCCQAWKVCGLIWNMYWYLLNTSNISLGPDVLACIFLTCVLAKFWNTIWQYMMPCKSYDIVWHVIKPMVWHSIWYII